jgi:two-component system OmpR family sensor kinase
MTSVADRADAAPTHRAASAALIIPAIAGALIFVVAVITSQVAFGVAERGQRALLERLGDVYLDGLSALTLPYVLAGDAHGLEEALRRMKTYHEGVRDLRIVVRRTDGTVLAQTVRDGLGPGLPPPHAGGAVGAADRSADRYWIQRPLFDAERPLAVLSAELDATAVAADRERTRLTVLGIDLTLSLLLAVAGYVVVRSVLRPVAKLESALLSAHGGRLAPIPAAELPSDGNEFGRLLRAYNAMVEAVDERERLRERLSDQQRVADLGRLAATVAHEVRNPVAGMLAAADTARRFGDDPEAVRTSVDLIERGLRNIGQVVDATLSIYRPASESRDLGPEDLEDLRLLAAPAARRRGISLKWNVALDHPFAVDAGPLRQILLNLLLNAASATPRGGEVSVDVRVAHGTLEVVVGDTGPGMPTHIRERIAGASSDRDGAGGLGIDVIMRLLRGVEGGIDVVSTPGAGTRIALTIPPRRAGGEAPGP